VRRRTHDDDAGMGAAVDAMYRKEQRLHDEHSTRLYANCARHPGQWDWPAAVKHLDAEERREWRR